MARPWYWFGMKREEAWLFYIIVGTVIIILLHNAGVIL